MTEVTYREIGIEDDEAVSYEPRLGDIVRIGGGVVEYVVEYVSPARRDVQLLPRRGQGRAPRLRAMQGSDLDRIVLLRRPVDVEPTPEEEAVTDSRNYPAPADRILVIESNTVRIETTAEGGYYLFDVATGERTERGGRLIHEYADLLEAASMRSKIEDERWLAKVEAERAKAEALALAIERAERAMYRPGNDDTSGVIVTVADLRLLVTAARR